MTDPAAWWDWRVWRDGCGRRAVHRRRWVDVAPDRIVRRTETFVERHWLTSTSSATAHPTRGWAQDGWEVTSGFAGHGVAYCVVAQGAMPCCRRVFRRWWGRAGSRGRRGPAGQA